MQMSSCKAMQFTWLGNGTAGNRKSVVNYESFRLGNLHISIGDFVLVRNDASIDPEDFSNSFVAQVKELFDTGVEPEPHRAKVQWFSRISELPSFALKFIDKVDTVNEVVEEKRINWSYIIDADTIFHKCLVLFLEENDDYSSFVSEYEDGEFPVFFCRYRFTGRRILPVMKSDGTPCSKSISLTPKQISASEVIHPERKERKEAFYSATTIGDSFLPKVLIKKMDDRILESQNGNVRIFIAQTHAEPMKKLNAKFQKNLSLNAETSVSEENPSNGKPIIHSLRDTSNCGDQNLKSNVSVYGCDDVLEESDSPNPYKKYNIRSKKRKAKRNLFPNASEKLPKPSMSCSRRKSITNTLKSTSLQKRSRYSLCDIKTSQKKINSTTRFGRKVKSVNYHVVRSSDEDNGKLKTSSNCIKKKSCSVIQIDSSDEEGSLFSCASVESSDDSVSVVSDCSLLDKDCKPITPRKKSKRSSVKKDASKLSLPKRETPLKTPQNVLEESRQRLHVSAVPKSLPCREEEYSDIYSFVKGCLCAQTGGCMYISGVPGTGKTATVHEVIRNLEEEKESGEVPLFSFVEVNGMWLTDPYQCYVQIFKSLTGETIAPQQAANLLEKRFTEKGPKKDAVVLLVDELDRLWTRKQTVMYNIFDWPSKKNSKLIVLAIANTMDLPERLMMNRISSRLGLTRKTFQPYTFKQLQEIIMSRIQELQAFDPDAVQLVARKVAAISGDARRALDICRFATEVVTSNKSSPKKKCKVLIGMEHVDIALQQMFSSPLVLAIRSSSNIAKLFFRGILSEFMRTGSEETTLLRIHQQVVAACRFEGQKPPNFSEVHNICAHLAASHLILVDNFQNDLHMKIRLNVSSDDVSYALTGK